MRRPGALAALATLLVLRGPIAAYGQSWLLDVSAGRIAYQPVTVDGGTNNMVGSLTYSASRGAWVYGSIAVPLDDQAPFWNAGGAGGRFTLPASGRITLGADLATSAFMFRDPVVQQRGTGAGLDALPFARLSMGLTSVELRGGLRAQTLSYGGASVRRGVFETGARTSYDGPLQLQGDVRWVRAPEGTYPFAGVSVRYSSASPVAIWGGAGKWMSAALGNTAWNVGTSIAVTDRSSIWASVRQDSPDPLYWNAERRAFAIGMTRRLGRTPASILPVRRSDAGGVVIRVSAADAPAGDVFVAGSFNNWKPQPMQREGRDWVIRLPLAAGVYHYSFRTGNGEWFVPASMPGRRDDGFGGYEAVLVVS